MAQVPHGSARTTEAVRRAIQHSQASIGALAERYGIDLKTVAKWRKRSSACDARMGPKEPRFTLLSKEEEAFCVALRKHTLLALDDCLYALQATIPHLTRSSLHCCFQPHGIGFFRIHIAELRTEEGKLYLFVAIDRTSKFAFTQLHERASRRTATVVLAALIEAVPYKIRIVLTDNGIQFCDMPHLRSAPNATYRTHMFDLLCQEHGIEHKLTKPNHPWANDRVKRMNRTLKEATVKRYHYGTNAQLRAHLNAFLVACNFAKRLKTLRGLTPHEYICKAWTDNPKAFRLSALDHPAGPYT